MRWWTGDPFASLFHDESLRAAMFQTFRLAIPTALVAVTIGTLFAIGIDRWHGRPARGANFLMLLSFVLPEMILGVSLFLVFTYVFNDIMPAGTGAQWLGLITFQMSYAVVIVRARLLTIGPEYEEAAMDLGATPNQSIRRVLLPLLWPAILASVAVVFADTVDDFVIVRFLSGSADSEPLSVKIYSAARGSPTPAVNAAATANRKQTRPEASLRSDSPSSMCITRFGMGTREVIADTATGSVGETMAASANATPYGIAGISQ